MPTPLETLRSMAGLSNLTPTGNAYADKRKAQIVSGEEEYAPSEVDLMQEQLSPEGAGFSRDQLRDSAMQKVKQALKMKALEHSQDMEARLAPVQLKGQFDLAASEASGRAMGDRLRFSQDSQNARSEANQAAILGRLDKQQEFQGAQNDANRAVRTNAAATSVPASLSTNLQKAQASYNSPISKAGRFIGLSTGTEGYKTALTSLLQSQGSLQSMLQAAQSYPTVEAAVADAQRQGAPLDPNEVAFLRLMMEQ